jgi:serine/threonine protein kinase
VLDKHLNARLIDFGLAREMNEDQTKVTLTPSKQLGTPGYFRTMRYSDLTVYEDYYNFGVGKSYIGFPSFSIFFLFKYNQILCFFIYK